MGELSHLDSEGHARMVDVRGKPVTHREATATSRVRARRETIEAIRSGRAPKGDVLAVARIAGIQAAKRCAELIPLCHPLPLTSVAVELELGEETVEITARAATDARTGVEMEALTAASVAALALYDMRKGIDRAMVIESTRLEEKSGGRRGAWRREGRG